MRSVSQYLQTLSVPVISLVAASCAAAPVAHPRRATSADRHIALMFFADAHGDLETHTELFWHADGTREMVSAGGYARLSTAASAVRRELNGRALLVDGAHVPGLCRRSLVGRPGDSRTPERAWRRHRDSGQLGGCYGVPRMRDLLGRLNYPVLAANVFDAVNGTLILPASTVRDLGGVRVGLVGYTDPDVPQRQSPPRIRADCDMAALRRCHR